MMETLFVTMLCYFLTGSNLPPSVCDDFSGAGLSSQIQWTGDTGDFVVNPDFELQLNASSGGKSALFFEMPYAFDMQWEMDVRLDFAPSESNRLKILLMSETPDPESGNAWFLEIGETGNQDPVRLYRGGLGTQTLLGESEPAIVAEQPVEITLKVAFTGNDWYVYAGDRDGPLKFLFTAHEEMNGPEGTGFFGLVCTYSASRSDKFYFDNICVGPYEPDTVPPNVVSLEVKDPKSLKLAFSEDVSRADIDADDFRIQPGEIQPGEPTVSGNIVNLSIREALTDGNTYTLHIRAISDTSGNTAYDLAVPFRFDRIEKAASYEWLIHEIMPDPSPAISLPDAEYIELYQNGLFTFDLGDYRIRIGSRIMDLPGMIVFPGTHIILCAFEDISRFQPYGMVVGVAEMPALPNNGTKIEILDQQDNLIHRVSYDRGWYGDPEKDGGGWSLEMINTSDICAGAENWHASGDLRGGTPGRANSVSETWPDLEGPEVLDVYPLDSARIIFRFDEDLSHHQTDLFRFTCVPDIDVLDMHVSGPDELELILALPLQPSFIYRMEMEGVLDCLGNPSTAQTIKFGLPEGVSEKDLVINEILFNPSTGGSRFVELLNGSGKVIRSDDLVIGQIKGAAEELVRVAVRKLILPGEMIAIADNPGDIMERYDVPNPRLLVESTLPGWGNEGGNVSILAGGIVIDSFSYRAEWHHPLIRDVNGVSLERISRDAPSGTQYAWQSAASSVGYATPTGENSQAALLVEPSAPFQFWSTTFSPDQDGYEDTLLIHFRSDLRDATASIAIHDHAGRFVRTIARNETIGPNEVFVWDGTNENGEIQRVGTYLVLIELFTADGFMQKFKDVCVLAGKF